MTNRDEFFEAIKAGHTDVMVRMIEADSGLLKERNEAGITPLMFAAYCGAEDIIALLRNQAVSIDGFEAAAVGDTDVLQTLLDADPTCITAYSLDGWSLLHLSAFFGRIETIRILLDRGADVDAVSTNPMQNTPLHAALAGAENLEVVACLIQHSADVNAAGSHGVTPLHLAASRGNIESIGLLLDAGAVSVPMENGQTPADIAVERGHEGKVIFLLRP
jgi:ankyrin repeat protein